MHWKTIREILCIIIISYLRRGGKNKMPARCLSIFKAVFLMCIMSWKTKNALTKTHDCVLKYSCGERMKINGPSSSSRYSKWTEEYRYQPYAVADQMISIWLSIYQQYINMIISPFSKHKYSTITCTFTHKLQIWPSEPKFNKNGGNYQFGKLICIKYDKYKVGNQTKCESTIK